MAHRDLLHATAEHAADFLDSLDERPIFPRATAGNGVRPRVEVVNMLRS
jgi:hypothetical protein